ncbi:hypothetical protein CJJ23_00265 [Mycoplasmopsis agassizii]|uniref:Uncharacterized protein n=1 Tax=Mycoplasmopsis agassizii TaxID=33922 RepID=A0A269TLX6_9BACT|nr:hypothetical protein CJJ23_00265 [Mycoplasmopsis agassizii]
MKHLKKVGGKEFINLTYTVPYNNSLIEKQFETVGFDEQRKKETVARELQPNLFKHGTRKIKVGIFDAYTISRNNQAFKNKNVHYYNYNETYEIEDSHADMVAAVVAGENGVDRFVDDIYSVSLPKNSNGDITSLNLPTFTWWM